MSISAVLIPFVFCMLKKNMATLNEVITKLNEKKVAKAGDTLSGSYLWNDSSGRTLRILKTDADLAFGYDWTNKQGGYIVCRSDTYGTKSNNSDYDGAIELYCRTNSKQNCCSILSNGTILNNGIAISVNSVGSNYVRFDNGIQICWGQFSTITNGSIITFPIPFSNGYYGLVADKAQCQNWNTASFKASDVTSGYVSYICIGKWK